MPEFRQWQAYAALHPIGPARDDWRIAQLAALYFNAHRGKAAPAKVSDFMWQVPSEDEHVDDEAEQLRAFLSSLPAPRNVN